jgi:hypothetical protein
MSTWTAFYVKTEKQAIVVEKLKALTGIQPVAVSGFPADLYDNFLMGEGLPYYLAIAKMQPDWVTVIFNSSNKLAQWSADLSKELETIVIVTLAQSVSDYYYFALYEKGKKRRELEFCYSADFENIDFGEKLSFENDIREKTDEDEDDFYFDYDTMEKYCLYFGLTLQADYEKADWTVLKGKKTGKTIDEFIERQKKPWWKIW